MNHPPSSIEMLSTTNLAKWLNIKLPDMFNRLLELGYIIRVNDKWELTKVGKDIGGTYRKTKSLGKYIVWPTTIKNELNPDKKKKDDLVTATTIGKEFGISASRMNSIFSELGWLKKDPIKGWHITELGKMLGGIESEHSSSGVHFVRWPQILMQNKIVTSSIGETKGDASLIVENSTDNSNDFRTKFPTDHRTKDGHYVRSRAEIIIDNWLYDYKIIHAYERKLPIEEALYCDFYIPTGKVYIEYLGSEDEKYLKRKNQKLETYKKHNLNLIELYDNDISNLDDTLPGKLLKFGIAIES